MSALLLGLILSISSISNAAGPAKGSNATEEQWAEQVLNVHACFVKALAEGKAQQAAGTLEGTMDAHLALSCRKELIQAENEGGVKLEDLARLLANVQAEDQQQ